MRFMLRFLFTVADKARGQAAHQDAVSQRKNANGRNCRRAVDPVMSRLHRVVCRQGLCAQRRAKALRPGQGVGAWMWVSRQGMTDVVDMDLAVSVTVFTLSSVSRTCLPVALQERLTDWGIP
jgi:hypothetical protein